jgi:hypothetical protein
MIGQSYHHTTMDSGEHWVLSDAANPAFLVWNSRSQRFRTVYDAARHPTSHYLQDTPSFTEVLVDHSLHGESQPNAAALNLLVQRFEQHDQ